MNRFKRFALASAVAGVCLIATALKSEAQVSIGVGVEPACPYGYYDYAPYACAPYGYYGPEWFSGGLFIGAGPWFRGGYGYGRGYGYGYGRGGYPEGRGGYAVGRGYAAAPRGGYSGGGAGRGGFSGGSHFSGGGGFHGGG